MAIQAIPTALRSTTEIALVETPPSFEHTRPSALWVVTTYLSSHDPDHLVLRSLGRNATLTQRWRLGGDFELRRYVARSTHVHTRVHSFGQNGDAERTVAAGRSSR